MASFDALVLHYFLIGFQMLLLALFSSCVLIPLELSGSKSSCSETMIWPSKVCKVLMKEECPTWTPDENTDREL